MEITAHGGISLAGHWWPCENPKRVVITMHGWRSFWSFDFGAIADFWHDNGCSVLFAEQRGQGESGGDTWASIYLDVLRTLNELGSFAAVTDGVIFHNTLASSDYGFLQHGTFTPRPNYFAVLLWNRLMGTTVYDCGNPGVEGAHIYCHSRRDGKDGCVYLVINNSLTETVIVELSKDAERYTLHAEHMRASVMKLNGQELTITNTSDLPELVSVKQAAGKAKLTPGSCTFFVM